MLLHPYPLSSQQNDVSELVINHQNQLDPYLASSSNIDLNQLGQIHTAHVVSMSEVLQGSQDHFHQVVYLHSIE